MERKEVRWSRVFGDEDEVVFTPLAHHIPEFLMIESLEVRVVDCGVLVGWIDIDSVAFGIVAVIRRGIFNDDITAIDDRSESRYLEVVVTTH